MWETRVQSLSWEDPLEKEMATHSSTLAWKIAWTEEPGRLQSKRSQRVGHDWATSLSFATHRFNLPIESLSFDSPMLNFDFVIEMLSHCQSSTLHLIQLSSLLLSVSLSFFFLDTLHSMWHHGSVTRDGTCVPRSGTAVLTARLPGKSCSFFSYDFLILRQESTGFYRLLMVCYEFSKNLPILTINHI